MIDTTDGRLVSTVEVGLGPWAIAITPDGRFAYVANQGFIDQGGVDPPLPPGDSVSVIDTTRAVTDPDNAVVATIQVGDFPFGIAITPDSGLVYVSSCGKPCDGSAVGLAVIDTTTNVVRGTLQSEAATGALATDGSFIYSASPLTNQLCAIDAVKTLTDPANAVVECLTVGEFPYAVALAPDGRFAYVVNCGDDCFKGGAMGGVAVVDTAVLPINPTEAVASSIPFPAGTDPVAVAITPDGRYAFVANSETGTVSVIDTQVALSNPAQAIAATINVGPEPFGVAIASSACPNVVPPPTPTPGIPCLGDCDDSGDVGVDEVITMVNIALGNVPLSACDAGDGDGSGDITVDEILTAVNNALNGCPA